MKELDQEERQHGATMQEISEAHKDLLRNLIDQQLWLSKGKELGITGETELINRLDEIRKQYNLASLEDLEKAAQEQGVSYEDFKANIRNQIITQEVMRQEVGRKISLHSRRGAALLRGAQAGLCAAGERAAERDSDLHRHRRRRRTIRRRLRRPRPRPTTLKPGCTAAATSASWPSRFSDGHHGGQGGDWASTSAANWPRCLKTRPFRSRRASTPSPSAPGRATSFSRSIEHTPGGVPPFKEVEQDVEQAYYMSQMEPAMRAYLTQMRDDAYIEIKPGYVDTGASPNKRVFPIAYSAYTPPAPKKKKKVERTRFRETTHTFRQKSPQLEQVSATKPEKQKKKKQQGRRGFHEAGQERKDPLRQGAAGDAAQLTRDADRRRRGSPARNRKRAPSRTIRWRPLLAGEEDPLQRPRQSAEGAQGKELRNRRRTPWPLRRPDAADIADRQEQSAPLGLAGDTASKKKKKHTTTGEKTRLSDEKKKPASEKQQPASGAHAHCTGTGSARSRRRSPAAKITSPQEIPPAREGSGSP